MKDFASHLKTIDKAVKKFETKRVRKWDRFARMGFCAAMQCRMTGAEWSYRSNRGGIGAYVLSFPAKETPDGDDLYLQIQAAESGLSLCLKIRVKDDERRKSARDHWHATVMGKGGAALRAPQRLAPGREMTLALWEKFPPLTAGRVDIAAVQTTVQEAQNVLDECIK